MTRKLSAGHWIAAVSAIVLIAAIVAGLSVVGGPGRARDLRLDAMRLDAMADIAQAAHCARTTTGSIPSTLDDLRAAARAGRNSDVCGDGFIDANAGDLVTYERLGDDQIRLCAEFRRSFDGDLPARVARRVAGFPELEAPRAEIGRRCYDLRIEL